MKLESFKTKFQEKLEQLHNKKLKAVKVKGKKLNKVKLTFFHYTPSQEVVTKLALSLTRFGR